MSTAKLATKWIFGLRTTRHPVRRHIFVVRSRLGLIQPRRPVSTSRAGMNVTAASNATMTEIAMAGPTAENTCNLVKTIARKVTDTVAADAAMTLPIDIIELLTAL